MGEFRLRIRNSTSAARTLIIEPWADELSLAPGRVYLLVFEGDPAHPAEIEDRDDCIVAYSLDSAGALVRVYDEDGRQVF